MTVAANNRPGVRGFGRLSSLKRTVRLPVPSLFAFGVTSGTFGGLVNAIMRPMCADVPNAGLGTRNPLLVAR